jgi:predicted oxidoreductase
MNTSEGIEFFSSVSGIVIGDGEIGSLVNEVLVASDEIRNKCVAKPVIVKFQYQSTNLIVSRSLLFQV